MTWATPRLRGYPNHDSNRHPNSDSNRHPSANTLPDPNRRNEAERGGALLITGGTVVVNSSNLTENHATGGDTPLGGAIYVQGTSASLELADKTEITGSADSTTSPNPNFSPTLILDPTLDLTLSLT